VNNFSTGQINAGCTPPLHVAGGNGNHGGASLIAADGTFTIDFDYTGTVGGSPSTGHFTITGHISGTTAQGTMRNTFTFTVSGVPDACESGLITWTATRTP